jgi:transcriptional regulator with XRE-family HTH domain
MKSIRERLNVEFADKDTRREYAESLLDSSIATQIKVIREQRTWTQAELAARAGMKQSRISAMEDVNYSSWNVNTLKRLAGAYDCGLEVRFVPFSRVIDWATNLNEEAFRVSSYEEEAASIDTATGEEQPTTGNAVLLTEEVVKPSALTLETVKPKPIRMSLTRNRWAETGEQLTVKTEAQHYV